MSFIENLFGRRIRASEQPKVTFGRYSDSYKSEKAYDAWDQSLSLFEDEKYLESYQQFFTYLSDDHQGNVLWKEAKGEIHFKFFQGSQLVTGIANQSKLIASAKVVDSTSLNIGLMRKLLERNFELKYCRFGVDDNNSIFLLFDTFSVDASPYKLYYGLKELAITGDKLDDLLLDEFKGLRPDFSDIVLPLNSEEKELKYQYIHSQLTQVIQEVESGKLDVNQYTTGVGFLMLALVYKLDFLIKPEGFMMETLERAHRIYYANNSDGPIEKNFDLLKELKSLQSRKKEDFFKEMYEVKSTFGITPSTSFAQIVVIINTHLSQMDWYMEEGYDKVAMSIPQFIVGHCLFNGAVPMPIKDLFILFYRVTEYPLFDKLGFLPTLVSEQEEGLLIDKKEIKEVLRDIKRNFSDEYPAFDPSISSIQVENLVIFAKSFLIMVRNLDLTKK